MLPRRRFVLVLWPLKVEGRGLTLRLLAVVRRFCWVVIAVIRCVSCGALS